MLNCRTRSRERDLYNPNHHDYTRGNHDARRPSFNNESLSGRPSLNNEPMSGRPSFNNGLVSTRPSLTLNNESMSRRPSLNNGLVSRRPSLNNESISGRSLHDNEPGTMRPAHSNEPASRTWEGWSQSNGHCKGWRPEVNGTESISQVRRDVSYNDHHNSHSHINHNSRSYQQSSPGHRSRDPHDDRMRSLSREERYRSDSHPGESYQRVPRYFHSNHTNHIASSSSQSKEPPRNYPNPNDPDEIYEWANSLSQKKVPTTPSYDHKPSSSSSRSRSSESKSRDSSAYYSGSRSLGHRSDHRDGSRSGRVDAHSSQSVSCYPDSRRDDRRHERDREYSKPTSNGVGHSHNTYNSSLKRKRTHSPTDFGSRTKYMKNDDNDTSSTRTRRPSEPQSRIEARSTNAQVLRRPLGSQTYYERSDRRSSQLNDSKYRPSTSRGSYTRRSVPRNKTPEKSGSAELDFDSNLDTTSEEDDEDSEESNIEKWVRSAPAELYYQRLENGEMGATKRALSYCDKFQKNILEKARNGRLKAEEEGKIAMEKHDEDEHAGSEKDDDDSDSYSEDSSDEEKESRKSHAANRELEQRKKHPKRLHEELWHNEPGLMNDGPVCRCSAKAKRFGIRHGFYPGESTIPKCSPGTNNSQRLHHYRINISPAKNFLVNTPTTITHDHQEYIFEGFSIFSHTPIDLQLPPCRVIRFNIRYDVFVEQEKFPESFCLQEISLFESYIFNEILELVDLKYDRVENSCPQFHIMPRFVRELPDNGKEILPMNMVLKHLLDNDKELVKKEKLKHLFSIHQKDWQNYADKFKGTIVTKWGMKPSSLRVDQIDRNVDTNEHLGNQPAKTNGASDSTASIDDDRDIVSKSPDELPFPLVIHFGVRPPQLSYAGNAEYQRAWRRYVKYRHLLSNMPKPSAEDKNKLSAKETKLQQMRTASSMKRDVTVAISSEGFRATGICCDIIQHAMLLPVLVAHLRFHKSLAQLESKMNYTFTNRSLLQLAMTHPSYRENFGTNPDHARNALTNCGIRQPEYGDRRIHYAATRKRGINTLINIMARFGATEETESGITHNERLEFLGDAVVEFVTSIHLFHIFPDLEEGGLATYRAAIVQNQHLAILAQVMELDQFMLYAHGSDLCHDSELRHAMANCFEALMGAIFIDGGIDNADVILAQALYGREPELLDLWTNYKRHPLQREVPGGDRSWIQSHSVLENLTKFENEIGVEFTHIRLLARAFTDRSLGYNNLTRGSNQRLEFLGDTVLQLISSEYLYRHFPDHHEGHLSLLRSSLVNNRTQSLVCDDLGMTAYSMRSDPKSEMKTKDRADLLEAFLGALYIDKGIKACVAFCSVCFIPRLSNSIVKQEWNDPKSKLQQCCLTLRAMDGKEPDIPVYKVIGCKGPTNSRIYTLAVSFRDQRLAKAKGHSIQEAEMNAAQKALRDAANLFPQLHHQKRVMDKTRFVR